MDRVNGADYIDIGGGRRGFRDENLQTGVAGTEVTALWLNSTQEEILKVVTEAGLAPNSGDWSQLWQALQILGLAPDRSRRWLAVNSITLSSAPGNPAIGDTYYIPANATGIWAGKYGQIAQWTGTSWAYAVNQNGQGLCLPDGRIFVNCFGLGLIEKPALDVQSGKWIFAVASNPVNENALVANLSPMPQGFAVGMTILIKVTATNTGPATLNVNGAGGAQIQKMDGSPVAAGDLPGGSFVTLVCTGYSWAFTVPTRSDVQAASAGYQQFFTANGTFVVPAGVTKLFVRVVGAGGGGGRGGAAYNLSGGGGAAGGYAEKYVTTTPGTSYAVTVGTKGARGDVLGGTGGTSSFGSEVSATGGTGGRGQLGSCAGGTGGIGVGGHLNILGGGGGDGQDKNSNVQGGHGGASFFGGGGQTADGGGGNGCAPGSGGGGAWGNTQAFGAFGADGLVIVSW